MTTLSKAQRYRRRHRRAILKTIIAIVVVYGFVFIAAAMKG